MRIVFLSTEHPSAGGRGGIGSYVDCIGPALAALGHDVHVVSCGPDRGRRDLVEGGVHVHVRPWLRLRGLDRIAEPAVATRIRAAVTCWWELRQLELDPDVVEAAEWMAEGLLVGLLRRTPLVVHLHSPMRTLRHYAGEPLAGQDRIADWLERWGTRMATQVTCPARLLVSELGNAGWLESPDAVEIIRLPVDVDSRDAGLPVPASNGSPVVVLIGRVESRKAPELVVRACGRLRSEGIPSVVRLIGRSSGERDGLPYSDWLELEAAAWGAEIDFVQEVSRQELPALLEAARVVAVPSHFESFSMAAVEAMSASRAVVASSTVGAAELFLGTGVGMVVEAGLEGWVDALRVYLVDVERARDEGERARRLVESQCRPSLVAVQRVSCYSRARQAHSSRSVHRRQGLRRVSRSVFLIRRR